jgi:hypothetical protein
MNQGAKGTELGRRMNSMALPAVSMLVKEDNRWSTMGSDKTCHSGQGQILDDTLPNTSDVGLIERGLGNHTHIITCHATIGTAIDEGAEHRTGSMVRKTAQNGLDIALATEFATNTDNVINARGSG